MRHERTTWLHDIETHGVVSCRIGRNGDRFVAEWPRVARLVCRPDGTKARVVRLGSAGPIEIARLRGAVNALIGDLQGRLSIHASSVSLGSRAVAMLGESGAGKSTAAAQLCALHGARLLSDDVAMLKRSRSAVLVSPSEEAHWLTSVSLKAMGINRTVTRGKLGQKSLFRTPHIAKRACRLGLLVWLAFDDSVAPSRIRPLAGIEAAQRLLGSIFRFDLANRRHELDQVNQMHESVPFVEICRTRRSPDATEAIIQAMEAFNGR